MDSQQTRSGFPYQQQQPPPYPQPVNYQPQSNYQQPAPYQQQAPHLQQPPYQQPAPYQQHQHQQQQPPPPLPPHQQQHLQQQQQQPASYLQQPQHQQPLSYQQPPPPPQHQSPSYQQQQPAPYQHPGAPLPHQGLVNQQPSPYHHHPGAGPLQAPHPPPQRQIDQLAIPSVAQLVNDEIETYKSTPQLSFSAPASIPPLVTTLESQKLKLSLTDNGCVRPCHMRSTIYQVPITKELLDSSGLEFSIVVKPFDDGEVDGRLFVPLSQNEIVRCNRCKAYANPFSRNGQCCICDITAHGMQEMEYRPELHLGSYEFRVTPEYYRDQIPESRRPHIIFAIEATMNSRHMVEYVSKNLASVIKSHIPTDFLYSSSPPPLVGFVTYNSRITIYDVKNGGHAYILCDMTCVTETIPTSNFLVDPSKNFEDIEKFLASLSDILKDELATEDQTVLGPAIAAALKTCLVDNSNHFEQQNKKANYKVVPTGKVYVLHSSLPTLGEKETGRLEKKNVDEMKKQLGTDSESTVLGIEGKYYTELAKTCIAKYASGIELFLFPNQPRAYLNVATLGELSKLTGTGVINKYHISSLDNFIHDLKISLKSTMGFDASMRVRTSTGISPVRYIGNFNTGIGGNLEMSAVNTNSNFIVQMKYDDKLTENDLVVIQFAMIYTSICGERRVRVHNLALTTCQNLADLYKSACCDTLVNTISRETIDRIRSGSLACKAAKEQLTTRVIQLLSAYRKHCTDGQPGNRSQLILPESLRLLPVYLCGALKCDAIDGGIEMLPDDKVIAQLNLFGSTPSMSHATVYPRMYTIIDSATNGTNDTNGNNDGNIEGQEENGIADEDCDNDNERSGLRSRLTRCYNFAIEKENGKCYVLENGYYLFIFFPESQDGQSFLYEVYGSHWNDPDLTWDMRQKGSSCTIFLEQLIEQISIERRRALRISVVRQTRDRMENVFRTFLYEDKKRQDAGIVPKWENPSYVDILVHLHKEITTRLSQ